METTFESGITQIVAATDLSDCSRNVLDHAIALARATGAGLTVVHARSAPDYDDLYRSEAREPHAAAAPRYSDLYDDAFEPPLALAFDEDAAAALARTHRDQLADLPRVRQVAIAAEPVDAILHVAQRAGAAIIVVGSRGRGAVAEALLGSTADAVIRRSGVAVLAV
ncbi:MAG TPA: universal stress protein, partial [Thermoanaerobaculia bacterium]|nr:universal stress protein [Thermoanaerobaculia bacterium]